MNPIQKRTNPFAQQIKQTTQPKVVSEPIEEEIEEFDEPEQVVVTRQVSKPARKTRVEEPVDNDRVKYTSTMDRKIRRSIRILCAERGILFASFVEEACKEKLRKEGAL